MANKRKNFIIDPPFQIKLSLIICSLVFIVSLIYPVAISSLFDYIIQLNPQASTKFAAEKDDLLLSLIITEVCLIGLVFLMCIFISHKIAGPIYKLKKFLREIRETGEVTKLSFRKNDYFQGIPVEFNQTMDFLFDKSEQERKYLSEIADYIENISLVVPEDKKPVLDEIKTKIKALQNYHHE